MIAAVGLLFFTAASAPGQATATPAAAVPAVGTNATLPAYEVVSVKPNASGTNMVRIMMRPNGFSASNVALKMLLQEAYGIKQDYISGAPSWTDSTRYDIEAKVSDSDVDALAKLTQPQRWAMLLPVFAERFKLATHIETKILPIYELVVAKGGAKVKEATLGDTYDKGIKGFDGVGHAGMMRMGNGQLTGQGIPMSNVVSVLSQQLHRTVVDKTGLAGKYDISLKWTPETDPSFADTQGGQPKSEPPVDSSGPSIFAALQEQLGLRLQPTKGPVDTLVVDHVDKPSEN